MKFGEKMPKRPYYWKLWFSTKLIIETKLIFHGVKCYTSDKNALRCMIPFVARHCCDTYDKYIVERFRIEDVDGHVLFDCFGDCFPEYERRHGIAK